MKIRLGWIPAHFYIFLSALALYVFSLQQNFSAAHDSITYLNNISSGKNLFHPHHLFYNYIARSWLVFWQTLFPSARDYIVIEMLSAIFGSASVAVCYLFLRKRASVSGIYASLAVSVIAFSYGLWSYSSNIEVYAPPLFFSLLVLYQVTSVTLTERKVFATALYTVAAILFHQVHALLAIVVILQLVRRFHGAAFIRVLTLYVLPVLVFVSAAYLFIAFYVEGIADFKGFIDWATLYAHGHDYWRAPGLTSLGLAATGLLHAFFGGHYLFKLPIQQVTNTILNNHNLADEHFLIRHLSQWQAVILLLLMLVVLIFMLGNSIRFFLSRSYRTKQFLPLLHALALYSCFFFFWMPENLEFWIFQSILFWVLVFASGPREKTVKRDFRMVGIVAASMFIVNYTGSILWLQDRDNDWYYSAVQPIIPIATLQDLVVVKDPWIMGDYVHRFVTSKQPADTNKLEDEIQLIMKSGARIFVINAQDSNSVKSKAVDEVLHNYSDRSSLFSDKAPRIYLIR